MGFNIKKAGGGLGKAAGYLGEKASTKSLSGGLGGIAGQITGTSKDAGILGVGQFKADAPAINGAAFTNDSESEARQAAFASQLNAANQRSAPKVAAAKLGPAERIAAAQAQGATIDQSQQAQFRAQQATLANQLAAQAAGQGPSLAQSQLQQATNRNVAQSMALAASQRGATAGQGLRSLAQQTSNINQQAAQQSADLAMQEQMAARQQLAGVAAAGREQDIGLATSQAGLTQQTSLANAGFTQQAALANQDAGNQFQLQQAQLNQQAGLANQQSALAQTGLNDAQSRFFNQGLSDMEQRDREAAMALEKLKVDQSLGVAGINSGAYTSASQARGNLIGGIGEGAAAIAAMSDKRTKKDITDGATPTDEFLKSFSASMKKDPEDASNPWAGQRQMGKGIGKGLASMGQGGEAAPISNMPQSAGGAAGIASMMAAHGAVVPGEAPYPGDDPRNDVVTAKVSPGEVIVPRTAAADEDKLKEFVKALSASQYRYKDPKHGAGTYVSPMAQELEKSELGRSMVDETPEGKQVNYARAGGLMLSTAAMLNDKVADLDARLAKALEKKKRSA